MDITNPTEKAAPFMHELFKFKIGAVLARVADAVAWQAHYRSNPALRTYQEVSLPTTLTMVERVLVECHGGVQMMYSCQRMTDKGLVTERYYEHELLGYDDACNMVTREVVRKPSRSKLDEKIDPEGD